MTFVGPGALRTHSYPAAVDVRSRLHRVAVRCRTCYLFPRLPTGLVGNRSLWSVPA
jgi:hypothetical protein